MNKTALFAFVFALAFTLQVSAVHAETATTTATTTTTVATTTHATSTITHTTDSLLETIKALLAKLESLKAELLKVRGEVDGALKDGLKQGMSDSDIKEIQTLLATDKEIYPAGMVTGYFGPMTTEAIKKFQEKNGLPVTGVIDAATKTLLEEYRKEHQMNRGEDGFMRAPGIMQKMHENMCARMPGSSNAVFCRPDFHPMWWGHGSTTPWRNGSSTVMHDNGHHSGMMEDDDDDDDDDNSGQGGDDDDDDDDNNSGSGN